MGDNLTVIIIVAARIQEKEETIGMIVQDHDLETEGTVDVITQEIEETIGVIVQGQDLETEEERHPIIRRVTLRSEDLLLIQKKEPRH